MDSLVTTAWLAAEIGATDLAIVDATYFTSLPGESDRDAAAEYAQAHIPGALFLDLADLHDTASPLPATMPSLDRFAAHVARLGIGDGKRIVFYDNAPHHTAARAWWLFRAFGITKTAILDGGFAKWRAEGQPVESGSTTRAPKPMTAVPRPAELRTFLQMKAGGEQVLDARGAARFSGDEPDPRPGVASGHIPGSRNLPYGDVLAGNGGYKDDAALKAAFDDAGIDLTAPVTMTCGSGITAAILAFAAHRLGGETAVYDGSWSEWGADPATPKATGPA